MSKQDVELPNATIKQEQEMILWLIPKLQTRPSIFLHQYLSSKALKLKETFPSIGGSVTRRCKRATFP